MSLRNLGVPFTAERNNIAKGGSSITAEERQAAGKRIKEELASVETSMDGLKSQLAAAAAQLPCDTHPESPVGPEDNARVVALHGTRRVFDFKPRSHLQLGESLGLFDFHAGSAVAGAGFTVLKGDGVLLELALVQWALSRVAAAGFTPIAPPDLAHSRLVEGCGFNPRDSGGAKSQVYSVADSDLCLIGTSEIPLAGLHEDAILDSSTLPAQYCAVSHCFRREAGSGGQRDKGLYRLHQFTKVEMFAYVAPDSPAEVAGAASPPPSSSSGGSFPPHIRTLPSPASEAMFKRLTDMQVSLFNELGLHFRVLDMPTEELGAAAYRKYDIEAWMPCRGEDGAGAYGEVSSASNCIDYQARRLNVRYKAGPKDNRFVHTLNATACAVPRTMLALLETHQQADGSVVIPPALRPFMGGREVLTPQGWKSRSA